MAGGVEFDVSGFAPFVQRLGKAAGGDFRKELELSMQALGAEFLRIVRDEIIRRKVVDTRLLLASFQEGSDGSVWEASDGGLTLEVGSALDYASYANDGHWANPKGVERRFVPGYWRGDRFVYDPGADGGMVLKQQWIEGAHYWDGAANIFEKMFPDIAADRMQEWIDKYFD